MGSKYTRASFTGHRPDKLIGREEDAKKYVLEKIESAIWDGKNVFITGMCPGFDVIAGEAVLEKKAQHPEIKLIAAMPYPKFAFNWADGWGDRVQSLLKQADYVETVNPSYDGGKGFQKRNEWMVDHSTEVIAYWDGTTGGTKNTVDYARKEHVRVDNRFNK